MWITFLYLGHGKPNLTNELQIAMRDSVSNKTSWRAPKEQHWMLIFCLHSNANVQTHACVPTRAHTHIHMHISVQKQTHIQEHVHIYPKGMFRINLYEK